LEKDAEIGTRIKYLRTHLKINQGEFSEPLGIDRSHIAGIENGSRNPSEPLLRLISSIYCVNLIWLKTGEGEMFVSSEEALKSQKARMGEQAFYEALNNIMKEQGLAVAGGRQSQRPSASDPRLDRMLKALYDIWTTSKDEEEKGWVVVQFRRAFPDDVVEEAQKKHTESYRQLSESEVS
jgi:transcriptional regulator with XRE-family HTH domain